MSQITGQGNTWNLPNYAGELFTADATQTPFLSMIGGLSGGQMTENFEFPTASLWDFPEPQQPQITETGSATAPTAIEFVRTQEKNVTQIFQEVVDLTYVKQSNSGRMSGINSMGLSNNVPNEKAWQIQQVLTKIARDVEYTFLNGNYQTAANAGQANKTRGMFELCSTKNTINAGGATLSKAMLDTLFRMMATNGAYFRNMVLFCNAFQKQCITALYASQFNATMMRTENIGGMNITTIETDFCRVGVVWDRFIPADKILIADMSYISPVFQLVPGKGILFEEQLAKIGASDRSMIFGQIGLAHAPAFLHGSITGLATSGNLPSGSLSISTINVTGGSPAVKASGTVKFAANPSGNDTLTIGTTTLTFKESAVETTDVAIGDDLAGTLDNIIAKSVTGVALTEDGIDTLTITASAAGAAGNSIAIACTSTGAELSGSYLSGGADTIVGALVKNMNVEEAVINEA